VTVSDAASVALLVLAAFGVGHHAYRLWQLQTWACRPPLTAADRQWCDYYRPLEAVSVLIKAIFVYGALVQLAFTDPGDNPWIVAWRVGLCVATGLMDARSWYTWRRRAALSRSARES
jgi:hypothetical protein